MSLSKNLFRKGLFGMPGQAIALIITKYYERAAIKSLKMNKDLWFDLNEYLKSTSSSGCSFIDYSYIYDFVIKHRPREILECGTGVTTLVIAHAMKKANINGRITSMESHKEWYEMAKDLFPKKLTKYVDFVLSPVIEDFYSFFRGSRYKSIPKRSYDFVFVDGPSTTSSSDKTHLFNYDFFHILKTTEKPLQAIIDKRLSTVWFLQKVLGDKVTYDPIRKLGIVKPSTNKDILSISTINPSQAFEKSLNSLFNSELNPKFIKQEIIKK